MGSWLFFLFHGGFLRCCPFPAACERCSPLPQQAHQDRHCLHLFLCKIIQFSQNCVGQQFNLIGLTSHCHWHRDTDMIYCRAELGGRKDGGSSLAWCTTGAWSRVSGSIRYYRADTPHTLKSHSVVMQELHYWYKTIPTDPSAFLNVSFIKSHAQKFTIIFDCRL